MLFHATGSAYHFSAFDFSMKDWVLVSESKGCIYRFLIVLHGLRLKLDWEDLRVVNGRKKQHKKQIQEGLCVLWEQLW